MKYLMLILFGLFAGLFSSAGNADGYDELWKKVEEAERTLPKSAYEIVEKIYAKATKEQRDDQLIKAIIYKIKLSGSFTDRDPATVIIEAEEEMKALKSSSARAVYASLLGQLYDQYGMTNAHRFQNRTQMSEESVEETSSDELPFQSLEDIQQKALDYYLFSLEPVDKKLDDLDLLLTYPKETDSYIEASDLKQFLLFRAIEHYSDSRSYVSLPTQSYVLNDPSIFGLDYSLPIETLSEVRPGDHHLMTMALYQNGRDNYRLSDKQRIWLETRRLQYLLRNAGLSEKETLYLEALRNLLDVNRGKEGVEFPYLTLIGYHLDKGRYAPESHNFSLRNHFTKAAKLLEALERQGYHSDYKSYVDNLKERLNKREFEVKLEQVNVPDKPFLGFLSYRNVPHLSYSIHRLEGEDFETFGQLHKPEHRIKYILDQPAALRNKLDLRKSDDHERHTVEFPIEGLSPGRYVMVTLDEQEYQRNKRSGAVLTIFHVSDLSYMTLDSWDSSVAYVANRTTGKPLENVTIEVYARNYQQRSRKSQWKLMKTLTSDGNGRFQYQKDGESFTYRLIQGDDYLDLRENHYYSKKHDARPYDQVQLFTDRAIYRPGQTVYYKGLALTYDSNSIPKIATGKKVTITFRDANWQSIAETKLVTDEYGCFSGHFRAPESGLTGQLQLEVRIGNNHNNHSIRVEEYKRPKLFVEMDSTEQSYVLGDTIVMSGKVNTFSGSVPSNAVVRYRIEKREVPRWSYGMYRRGYQGRELENVGAGETSSDDKGHFSFSFPTKTSGNNFSRFSYVAHVDIVDETGESTETKKTLVLSEKPFFLDIKMGTEYFAGEVEDVNVLAKNAEQKAIVVGLKLSVIALDHPEEIKREKYWGVVEWQMEDSLSYLTKFPHDHYGLQASPQNWPQKATVKDLDFKGNSFSIGDLNELKEGVYKLVFSAEDSEGNKATEERYLFISDKTSKAIPSKHLWVTTPASVYEPGQVLDMHINTPYDSGHIIYRIHHGQDALNTQWIAVNPHGKLEIPIVEEHRGGFSVDIAMVKNNRLYTKKLDINVPWSNKELEIEYATFRDKLEPGAEENWTLKFKDREGDHVNGQLLAAMYDASLDQFVTHNWEISFFPSRRGYNTWSGKGFGLGRSNTYMSRIRNSNFNVKGYSPQLNMFGLRISRQWRTMSRMGNGDFTMESRAASEDMLMSKSMPAPEGPMGAGAEYDMMSADEADMADGNQGRQMDAVTVSAEESDDSGLDLNSFSIRENLNETVFFYPELEIENGDAQIEFTMNEALTKWKLLLFGHTKKLQYVFDTKEVVTQKKLMIEPFMPRFVRQGDEILITAKISNLSAQDLNAVSQIQVMDAMTDELLDKRIVGDTKAKDMTLKPGSNDVVEWRFQIPDDHTVPLKIKMVTKAGNFSDGEQNIIPVLSNRMLVTETMPMHIGAGETKTFDMAAMNKMDESSSLTNHNYSVEMTLNPAWIVAKAIPFLTAENRQSSKDIFEALYGNLLMQDLLHNQPQIRNAIFQWKEADLKSPLRKNSDLKLNDLNETPWVRDALSEEAQMAQLSLFLDDNQVNQQINSHTRKLKQRQLGNGGFSWMPGGRDNWYITQNILEGIGHLRKLGIESFDDRMVASAVRYIDERMKEYYEKHGTLSVEKIQPIVIHYLYVRSFFRDISSDKGTDKIINHYFGLGSDHWQEHNSYTQGMLALAAHRYDRDILTKKIGNSLSERMIKSDELGYYWNDQAGYYWYDLNIEKQALMIELYHELEAEQDIIDGLKLWLLKTKQTNSWKTTKATSSACYAFLLDSDKWLKTNEVTETTFPLTGKRILKGARAYATGYLREDIPVADITTSNRKIEVTNPSETVVWGAAYWQYFEDLDKIETFEDTPLKIQKEIFKVGVGERGEELVRLDDESAIKPGDRLRVRILLQVDRPMEFIEMKDMRSSGLEPVNVLSQYKWQDGLGYYESTKDVASYFYFDFLPKGNWVFEYDVKAAHKGSFSNGITQIQSIYAPEFSSHSTGQSLEITN